MTQKLNKGDSLMWFKQIQILQLDQSPYTPESLMSKLEPFAFRPCLPSMLTSIGWVSPIDEEDEPLVLAMNGYIMLCLQLEEKILPAIVIRQAVTEKIKQIELNEARKIRQKEKLAIKDEMMLTLLPRAFTKISRLYAYIDTKKQRLILNTTNAKKAEQFVMMFKKAITENVQSFELKKLSPIITHWIKHQEYPGAFGIEKKCLLQDPNQQTRMIRCQDQDLFAGSIQALIKDGCEVKQLALSWQDRVNFVLSADDFTISGVRYLEEITSQAMEMEAETKKQQFIANFFIMTETLTHLFEELINVFSNKKADLSTAKVA